jgi:hypothetical protein
VNGRGRIPDEIPNAQDATDNKAVSLWAGVAPSGVPGLELGAAGYLDTLPPDGVTRQDDLRERILGGYLVYQRHGVELLSEVSRILHEGQGQEYETWGFYAQGGLRFGRWTPYYRFDRVEVAENDPFLSPLDVTLRWACARTSGLGGSRPVPSSPRERGQRGLARFRQPSPSDMRALDGRSHHAGGGGAGARQDVAINHQPPHPRAGSPEGGRIFRLDQQRWRSGRRWISAQVSGGKRSGRGIASTTWA